MPRQPRQPNPEPEPEPEPEQAEQLAPEPPPCFESQVVGATLARLLPMLNMEALAAEVADRAAEHLAATLGLARVAEQLADHLAGHLAEDAGTSARIAQAVAVRLLAETGVCNT
jgi:hypothetical protein